MKGTNVIGTNEVNIAGIDKAAILAALFNRSQPVGMGILQALMQGNHPMTVDEAQALIDGDVKADNDFGQYANRSGDGKTYYFDYVRGRPLKIDLSGDTLYTASYDRDNGGDGTAASIIDSLR